MYTIAEIKGHQYRLSAGDLVDVEKFSQDVGATIELSQVLFVGGETPIIGTPVVAGAKLIAKVVRHGRGDKVLMYRKKSGKWKKRKGHRQDFTCLLITEIQDGKGGKFAMDKNSPTAQKFMKEGVLSGT
ncbi:MAG: 50S ribosomal protein L21 [Bacteriovoracaceae bacterium]|nr:50S ribosomal protein L21 [Bacteriovoracaceae bacterium]